MSWKLSQVKGEVCMFLVSKSWNAWSYLEIRWFFLFCKIEVATHTSIKEIHYSKCRYLLLHKGNQIANRYQSLFKYWNFYNKSCQTLDWNILINWILPNSVGSGTTKPLLTWYLINPNLNFARKKHTRSNLNPNFKPSITLPSSYQTGEDNKNYISW